MHTVTLLSAALATLAASVVASPTPNAAAPEQVEIRDFVATVVTDLKEYTTTYDAEFKIDGPVAKDLKCYMNGQKLGGRFEVNPCEGFQYNFGLTNTVDELFFMVRMGYNKGSGEEFSGQDMLPTSMCEEEAQPNKDIFVRKCRQNGPLTVTLDPK
ncbi:hypothetical protein DCS_05957 [Drechmeria coniospora]|uniref:AA1-like domain-containing protein n=1 Tax=Drechmeria coniospora TaxID=98403 RepID=A0A151GAA2_DRECN|nr:hypothetical protein DCS_05957 [Drechmeria coniospora]KYK54007.1 hypothetical protein DCS_05957 [Drechmeria coniospora]